MVSFRARQAKCKAKNLNDRSAQSQASSFGHQDFHGPFRQRPDIICWRLNYQRILTSSIHLAIPIEASRPLTPLDNLELRQATFSATLSITRLTTLE